MASTSGVVAMSMCVVVALVAFVPSSVESYTARERNPNPRSCREAEMCCQGQNNTCFVFGDRMDLSQDSKKCYCDSNCIIMGDCCTDYHYHCRSVDCQVADWATWTECDNPCGFGARRRTRTVSIYPGNGGALCPVLKQRRACVGFEKEVCDQNEAGHQLEEMKEQARILPLEFGQSRLDPEFDKSLGLLKNLKNYYKTLNTLKSKAQYVGKYEVITSHYGCKDSAWGKYISVNSTVCVECQPIAMSREAGTRCIGHGVAYHVTRWKAVDVPHCHGTWKMVAPHEQASVCDHYLVDDDIGMKKSFIFI